MLMSAIRLASEAYHVDEPLERFYDSYMREKRWECWERADTVEMADIERLVLFLNQWKTRYENTDVSRTALLGAVREVIPLLQPLRDDTILTVDFERVVAEGQTVRQTIERAFHLLRTCGRRQETTGAAKIIHTINPHLFVMWDLNITWGYAVGTGSAEDYAGRFLPRMQKIAWLAVDEYRARSGGSEQEAVDFLCERCGHPLAKVLDEFNYCKFTLRNDLVWDAELRRRDGR